MSTEMPLSDIIFEVRRVLKHDEKAYVTFGVMDVLDSRKIQRKLGVYGYIDQKQNRFVFSKKPITASKGGDGCYLML